MTTVLEARNVYKTYRLGRVDVPVLRGASLSVGKGECVAVLGASGSGKSTLLHLLGGLDRPSLERQPARHGGTPATGNGQPGANGAGEVLFDGRSLARMSAGELDHFRSAHVGFVFQFYHLLPELDVMQNTLIAAMVRWGRVGYTRRAGDLRRRARELLERFGLSHRLRHRPVELSGGERQRVAIARALMNSPPVLLADEPTGNLDQKTGASILDAIMEVRRAEGLTMVLVSHDERVAHRADRIVNLVDGKVA